MQSSGGVDLRDKLLESLNVELVKGGWIPQKCEVCSCLFYGTKKYKVCASEKCGEPTIEFDGEPNHFISIEELNKKIELFFNKSGYSIEKPLHMLHSKNKDLKVKNLEDSLFTMAGVQILDDFLFHEMSLENKKLKKIFIARPSVRLLSISKVGSLPGFYTSFINVCSEHINPTLDEYLKDLFLWIKLIDELFGLQEIRLKVREKIVKWNDRKSPTVQIFFYYKGMELGDAGFHYEFPQKTRDSMVVSDIGFGLERLCICINKNKRHFDLLGPYLQSFMGDYTIIDRTRTLVLLIGSNILPSDTPHGTKVRSMIKDLFAADKGTFKWLELVPYFYAFWSGFTQLELSPLKIRDTLRSEIYRQNNRKLATDLKLNISNEELIRPTYEFVELYIHGKYGKVESLNKLDAAIKNMFL